MIVSSPFAGQRTISNVLSSSRSANTGRRDPQPPTRTSPVLGTVRVPRAGAGGARWFRAGMRARAPASSPSPAPVLRAFFVNEELL